MDRKDDILICGLKSRKNMTFPLLWIIWNFFLNPKLLPVWSHS